MYLPAAVEIRWGLFQGLMFLLKTKQCLTFRVIYYWSDPERWLGSAGVGRLALTIITITITITVIITSINITAISALIIK